MTYDAAAFLAELSELSRRHRIILFDGGCTGGISLYPIDESGRRLADVPMEGVRYGENAEWKEEEMAYGAD